MADFRTGEEHIQDDPRVSCSTPNPKIKEVLPSLPLSVTPSPTHPHPPTPTHRAMGIC